MEQKRADEVLLSSDEDLLMAKYEFYLELLESYKEDKEKEQYFVTVSRIISSAQGHAVRQPLNELISTYNSELRNLEKGRKPWELVIKKLDEMVELIEQTDLLIKQFEREKFQIHGKKALWTDEIDTIRTLREELGPTFSGAFPNRRAVLAIYATLKTVVNWNGNHRPRREEVIYIN